MADEKTNREAFPMETDEVMADFVGIADHHIHDRISSNPGFTADFSGFANNVDGFSNLAHNVGRSSNFARNVGSNSSMVPIDFFVPHQNMHGWTLTNNNVHFVQGFGENVRAGFQVVNSNTGFSGSGPQFQAYQNVQGGIFPERRGLEMSAAGQQFPAYLNRPVQIVDRLFPARLGLPLPGHVMPVARGIGPPQASNIPIGPSYMRYTTRFPPIARPIQCTTRLRRPTHQSTSESAHTAPSLTRAPKIYPVPPQAQTATSLSPLPTTEAFLKPASKSTTVPNQAQTAHPSSSSAKEITSLHISKGKSKIIFPTRPPVQGMPIERGNGLAQPSNSSVRHSLKRGATQPLSIAHPCQRRTIHSSMQTSAQTPLKYRSPNAPVPPQALTAVSFPSFPRTGGYPRTLSQNHALPYPLQTARTYSKKAREIAHIRESQDLNRFPQPVGYSCFLCNLDLAFTPGGQILQTGICPAVAVLPCGHHFHDYCLQQITPADQTENPPCIECQKREIEEENMK